MSLLNSPYGPFEQISYMLSFPQECSAEEIMQAILDTPDHIDQLKAHLKHEVKDDPRFEAFLEGVEPCEGPTLEYRCSTNSPYCSCPTCEEEFAPC